MGDQKYFLKIEKKDRYATDIPCCLWMIAALVVQFVIFIVAVTGDANVSRLTHISDYEGNICDKSNDDGRFGMWPDIRVFDIRVCMDNCDDSKTDDRVVTPPWDTDTTEVTPLVAQSVYGYRTKKFLGIMCLPDPNTSYSDCGSMEDDYKTWSKNADNFQDAIDRAIADMQIAFPILLGACFGALLLSFLYIKALQYIADVLVWVSIVMVFVGLVLIGTFLIRSSDDAYALGYDKMGDLMYYCGIIIIVLDVMYVLAVCFTVKRILLAIAVAEEATYAMRDAWQLVFFPIIPFLLLMAYGIYWFIVAVTLASVTHDVRRDWPSGINTPYFENGKTLNQSLEIGNQTTMADIRVQDSYKYALFYHLFVLFWVVAFIGYAAYMVITGVYAEWYFADWADSEEEHKKIGNGETEFSATSMWDWWGRVIRYHFGTVAVAAFAIALVNYIDFCLTYFEKQLVGTDPTPIQKVLLGIIHCLLRYLACIMDRINKNGITITAIYGWPFCMASMKGIELMFSNIVRASALGMVSGYLIGIGQMSIVAFNVGITMAVARMAYGDQLSSILIVAIVAGVMSYAISWPFLELFETSIDSLFICFLIDESRNKGGHMRASKRLLKVINEDVKPSKKHVSDMKDKKKLKGWVDTDGDGEVDTFIGDEEEVGGAAKRSSFEE
jgi:hypothetical protein